MPLVEAARAHELVERAEVRGKIVLMVGEQTQRSTGASLAEVEA